MPPYDLNTLAFDIKYDKETDSLVVACRIESTNNHYIGEIYATRVKKQNKRTIYYTYNGQPIAYGHDETNKQMTKMCELLLMSILCHDGLIKLPAVQ